jgi:3',5'-cyclic-AMP phosphodiesterase
MAMPFHLPPDPTPPLNRRSFLAGLAAAGASLPAGCARRAGSRGNPGGWYAWLSDPHIAADPAAGLRGEVMADNLRKVVADVLAADDPPHGVVIDGDLAFHDGQPGDYRTLLDIVAPLRRDGIPIHLALGNHDDRDHFRDALGQGRAPLEDKQVGVVEGDGLRLLLLDSLQRPNVTGGRLGERQLAWLGAELDAHPATPAVIFVHHNLNAEWASALLDTRALLELLGPRRQAKAVVFGHTHVWNVRPLDGLYCINLPAVGYRFLPKQPLGWCAFRPRPDGGELELRCIGGDRRQDGRRVSLRWRA